MCNNKSNPPASSSKIWRAGKKYKLLIIEDDFLNQKLFEASLSKNLNVKICNSAKSFYQLLDQEKYDIFLVDISINGRKNGLDLIKELRNTEQYQNVAIACLSAHVSQIDRVNALKAGADIFLTKPIENNVLTDSLLELIQTKKLYKEI